MTTKFSMMLKCLSVLTFATFLSIAGLGQCVWYTITLDDSNDDFEVTWQLINADGVEVAAGGAPYEEDICLPDGCYTLLMFDSAGDGWEHTDWIIEDWTGDFDWDTNLEDGFHGDAILDLGETGCSDVPAEGVSCGTGLTQYALNVTEGDNPEEISWYLMLNGQQITAGGAPFTGMICLTPGCYSLFMYDSGLNSWENATYSLSSPNGITTYFSGTMTDMIADTLQFSLGGVSCTGVIPVGPGTGGNGCGTDPPSPDCPNAACVCDPYNFQVTPVGFGAVYEIPSPGSLGNPSYSSAVPPPWGGTDTGCLLAGELNSHWMMFTIANDGMLEFNFGAGGQQAGYYDWEMWEYSGVSTCSQIANNTLAPVRCTWNAISSGGTGIASAIPAGGNAGNYGPPLAVTAGQQFIICLSNWSYVTANVTLDFTGTAQIECNLLLPVNDIVLSAVNQNHRAIADWSVYHDQWSSFELQHSMNGVVWSTIAVETDIHQLNYSNVHSGMAEGTNYYRVRGQTNGQSYYSNIVALEASSKRPWSAYPNPVSHELRITGALPLGRWEIFDAAGRIVQSLQVINENEIFIDASNLQSGMYYIGPSASPNQSQFLPIMVIH